MNELQRRLNHRKTSKVMQLTSGSSEFDMTWIHHLKRSIFITT